MKQPLATKENFTSEHTKGTRSIQNYFANIMPNMIYNNEAKIVHKNDPKLNIPALTEVSNTRIASNQDVLRQEWLQTDNNKELLKSMEADCKNDRGLDPLERLTQLRDTQNPQSRLRCGYFYNKTDPSAGGAALGFEQGSVSHNPPGVWNWDLKLATEHMHVDLCKNIQSCSDIARLSLKGRCAWCIRLEKAVPLSKNGKVAYPWNKIGGCPASEIATSADKCPTAPPPDEDEETPPEPCDPLPDGRLARSCVLDKLRSSGCSDRGAIARALAAGHDNDYMHTLYSQKAYNIYQQRSSTNLNVDGLKTGKLSMNDALNEFDRLAKDASVKDKSVTTFAARDLCLNQGEIENFDFCTEVNDSTVGPYLINCLQKAFIKSGGQKNGSKYPSPSNMSYWNSLPNWKAVLAAMQDINNKAQSSDSNIKYRGTQELIDVNTPDPFQCTNNQLPRNITLSKGAIVAKFTMTQDYKIEFDITPKGGVAGPWGSILHITSGPDWNSYGSRTPAFWFEPNGLNFHAYFGDSTEFSLGFHNKGDFSFGKKSRVSLEAKGRNMTLKVDSQTFTMTQPNYRYSGPVIAYACNPWHNVANCILENVCLQLNGNSTPIPALPDWIQTMQKPNNWKHKPGGLLSISITENGTVFGVGSGNIVYKCANMNFTNWEAFVDGRLKQVVAIRPDWFLGIGTDDNIYRQWGGNPSVAGGWKLNGPNTRNRIWSAGGKDGWTFSLTPENGSNNIFFGDGGLGGTNWNIPGGLSMISYGPDELWGVSKGGYMFRYNGTAEQIYRQHARGEKLGTDWQLMPRPPEAPGSGGWAKFVAVSPDAKRIVATGLQPHGTLGNPTNALYAWHKGKWIPVCGARGQVAICDSMIVWIDEQEGRQTTPYGAYSVYFMNLVDVKAIPDTRTVHKLDLRNPDTQSFNIGTHIPLQAGNRVDTNFPNMPTFDACISAARVRYPGQNIGVTYLDGNSWIPRNPGTCWAVPMEPFSEGSNAWAWGWKSAFVTNGDMPGIEGVTKIQIAGGGNGQHLQLSQVVVFDSKGRNVSIGQVAGGSPVFQANTVPSKATDGVHAPRNWPDMSCSTYQPPGKIVHWEIGLRQPTTVSAIIIYNRNDCCQDRLNHYNMHMFNSNLDLIYWKPNIGSGLVNILKTNASTNQAAQTKGHFNGFCYSNRYGDLYNAFDRPMGPGTNDAALQNHYNIHGRNEGRNPQC